MTYRKLIAMVSDTRLGAARRSIGAAMCMTMAAMFLLAAPMGAWAQAWNGDAPTITGDANITISGNPFGTLNVPGGATVTITGSAGGSGNTNLITLNIGAGATVHWQAQITGAPGTANTGLVRIDGSGTFNVPSGGSISSSREIALILGGAGTINISGGTVARTGTASGQAIRNMGSGGTINVTSGTVRGEGPRGGITALSDRCVNVNVSGGNVTATNETGPAIDISCGTITISGTATLTSRNTGSSAGTVRTSSIDGILNIHGGTITNTGSGGYLIGAASAASEVNITVQPSISNPVPNATVPARTYDGSATTLSATVTSPVTAPTVHLFRGTQDLGRVSLPFSREVRDVNESGIYELRATTTLIARLGATEVPFSSVEVRHAFPTVTINPADYTFNVATTQNIIFGSGLPAITVVPANPTGTGVGGANVAGTFGWFSNSARTTPAADVNLSSVSIGGTVTLYWRFTANDPNYTTTPKEGSTVFTIVAGTPQNVTFPAPTVNRTFGDAGFTHAATNNSSGGGAITYASDNTSVATVNATTGAVTIVSAGTAVITATAAVVPGQFAVTTTNYTLTVNQRNMTGAQVGDFGTLTYNGSLQTPVATVMVGGLSATGSWGQVTNVGQTTTFTASGNFTGTITEDPKMNPLAVTIIPEAKSKVFGAADPALTFTTNPAPLPASWDPASIVLTRVQGDNVGNYPITMSANNAGTNYDVSLSTTPVYFTINPASSGTFPSHGPITVPLTTGMTLGSIDLPANYAWADPAMVLTAANSGQALAATYTQSVNHAPASGNITVNLTKSVTYIDAQGASQPAQTATIISTHTPTALPGGWYVAPARDPVEAFTVGRRLEVTGAVNIILEDRADVTINGGIRVQGSGNSLTIWGQSRDNSFGDGRAATATGKLTATSTDARRAGIGGNQGLAAGTITINGGHVTARSTVAQAGSSVMRVGAAAIGGGSGDNTYNNTSHNGGDGGTININGGTVVATAGSNDAGGNSGGMFGAGIGGGSSGATSNSNPTARGGDGGTINIRGGHVIATGGGSNRASTSSAAGAGIGGGGGHLPGNSGAINISGGTVVATVGLWGDGGTPDPTRVARGFDIGGGGGVSLGTWQTHTLTSGTANATISGGVVELTRHGIGGGGTPRVDITNARIWGSAADNREGTYNNDGKHFVNVTEVTAAPTSPQVFGTPVTLTANLHVTRTTGLTNPAPSANSGVQFFANDIAIGNVVMPTEGSISGNNRNFTVTSNWTPTVADIDNHTITARWVVGGGTDSRYAAGETGTLAGGFTVTKKTLTADKLTVTNLSHTYNSDPQGATVAFNGPNTTAAGEITVQYQNAGYPKSTIPPTNAGTYDVLVSTAGGNEYYPLLETNVGPLTINKATSNASYSDQKSVRFNDLTEQTVDLSSFIASYNTTNATLTYAPQTVTGTHPAIIATRTGTDNGIIFTIAGGLTSANAGNKAIIPVVISNFLNYNNITVNVEVELTAQTTYISNPATGAPQTATTTALPTSGTINAGWYHTTGGTISNRLVVSGVVNIILVDGTNTTINGGIRVADGNTLNIFAQSQNADRSAAASTGCLTATGGTTTATSTTTGGSHAAIGGNAGQTAGTIIINGGNITATSTTAIVGSSPGFNSNRISGAGIGGGSGLGIELTAGDNGTVRINGGTVNATSGSADVSNPTATRSGAGIGGGGGAAVNPLVSAGRGGHGGTIEITGGHVTATSGSSAGNQATATVRTTGAGIGGGAGGDFRNGVTTDNSAGPGNSGDITISGGTVIAQSGSGQHNGQRGFDIGGGGGRQGNGTSNVTISGGTVELRGNGIGGNPTITSARIHGTGAGNHEGIYNANGKHNVNVISLTASPASPQVFGTAVTLTADYVTTRAAGLVDPAPEGGNAARIQFYVDGAPVGDLSGAWNGSGQPIDVIGTTHRYRATYIWTPALADIGNRTITAAWVTGGTACRYEQGNIGTLAGGFTVTKKTLTVDKLTVTDLSHTYNSDPQGATVAFNGPNTAAAGEITVQYQNTDYPKNTTPPTNAGTYDVLVSTAGGNEYYPLTETNFGPLTINKKTLASPYYTYHKYVRFNDVTTQTVNLSGIIASYNTTGATLTYTPGTVGGIIIATRDGTAGGITFTITGGLTAANVDNTGIIPVTISGFANYEDVTINVEVKITDKTVVDDDITVTAPANITYGETLGNPQASVSGDIGLHDWTYTYSGELVNGTPYAETTDKPTLPGTYIVTAELVSTTHAGSGVSLPFTIARKQLSWNADGTVLNRNYDGTTSATVADQPTFNGILPSDVVNVTIGTVAFVTPDAAASVAVTASGYGKASTDDYWKYYPPTAQPAFANGVITPLPVTIIPTSGLSKVFGGNRPPLTYTTDPASLPASWDPANVVLTHAGINAGTYPITIGTDNSGGNYAVTLSTTPVNFTINRATSIASYSTEKFVLFSDVTEQTVDLSSLIASYNTPAATLTYAPQAATGTHPAIINAATVSATVNGVVTFAIAGGLNAANDGHTATIPVVVSGFTNYNDITVNVVVEIIDKVETVVTVTAPTTGLEYGQTLGNPSASTADEVADADWTYTYAGTLANDAPYTATTAKPTLPGTYTVTAVLVSATHIGSGVSATFTIARKPLTWTQGVVAGKTYDGTTAATVTTHPTLNLAGVINDDVVTAGSVTNGTAAFTSANAGASVAVVAIGYSATIGGADAWKYTAPAGQPSFANAAIGKATPTYTAPAGLTATYGQTLADVDLSAHVGWSWVSVLTTPVGDAGTRTHKATFTPTDTDNYNVVTDIDVTVTVGKATPTYTTPAGLTATFGQTLADVDLSAHVGWSWVSVLTTPVGDAGTQTHKATFTPTDTDNYNIATDIDLTITVGKAATVLPPPAQVPTVEVTASGVVFIGGGAGVVWEYSVNGGAWQSSAEFASLTPGAEHKFSVRVSGTDNHLPSEAVDIYVRLMSEGTVSIRTSDRAVVVPVRERDDAPVYGGAGGKYGITLGRNVVSSAAEFTVRAPNGSRSNIVIYDHLGNVVFRRANVMNGEKVAWDLRVGGRPVTDGTYLIVAAAKDRGGKVHRYSARLGVRR